MMQPGYVLMTIMTAFVIGFNERFLDLFRDVPDTFCDAQCDGNRRCFRTEVLQDIPVSGNFVLKVQATQAIAVAEVKHGGFAGWLLRNAGANDVPGYPKPDRDRIVESHQFKTTNALMIAGRVENGSVVLIDKQPAAQIAATHVFGIGIEGKKYVHGPFRESPTRYQYCLLGAIARPAAIMNGGKRIVIGSRLTLDVRMVSANEAILTPSVACSRFPTTFIWIERDDPVHLTADSIQPVLKHCATWR